MPSDALTQLLAAVTEFAAGRPLDPQLEQQLNASFPPEGPLFRKVLAACHAAIEEGWMCNREAGGIKYGRVLEPGSQTHGFSVDVVDMANIAGPHHRHPRGEIDLVMPTAGAAKFDGRGAGWRVYGPGSAHHPTISDGRALVLYLLPGGEIEFTRTT